MSKIGRNPLESTAGLKTLIHHSGALGDLLLSLRCIGTIRRLSGLVHIAGGSDAADFLREAGYADEASSAEAAFYSSLYTTTPDEKTMEFLSRYDRAFLFTLRSDSRIVENFRKAVRQTETIITIPPPGVRRHVSEYRMEQLSHKIDGGSDPALSSGLLRIPSLPIERAEEFLAGSGYDSTGMTLIGMHPGSGGKGKCWSIERYLALAGRMKQDRDIFFLFFSGPAEGPDVKEKVDDFARRQRRVIHVSNARLVTVAALLSLCHLYVGNDSGVTHLAAAVNADVLALFGPTDPFFWKPLGRGVEVISALPPAGFPQAITVEAVYERMTSFLSRR